MSNTAPQKINKGFTLVELLVVIAIIAILSVIGMTVFSGVQDKARQVKITGDFDAMYKNIEIARITQQKTLLQLTGMVCSQCNGGCSTGNWVDCLSIMTTSYAKVTSAKLPLDPWGHPYMWNENEGEAGIGCLFNDTIQSVGPDGLYSTADDKWFSVPFSGYTGCQ